MGLFVDRVVSGVESGSPLGVFRRADEGDKGSVMGRFLALLMTVVVALTACSGEEAAPTTSSSTTTSTTEPTTTTSSTRTTTTSTTEEPLSDVEAEVEAAYLRAYEVFVECYRTLPDCDPNAAFSEVYAEPTLPRQVIAALQTKEQGLVYGPPVDPDNARTEVLDIVVDQDATEAVVSFCTVAADQEYLQGTDGTRTLTDDNDLMLVSWGDAVMVLERDGVWRVSDYPDDVGDVVEFPPAQLDERVEEGVLCGGFLAD